MCKENTHTSRLTEGDIRKHLARLSLPMIGGMVAMIIFNLTDTFFVSRLGTDALAAMGFTFPVVMTVGALSTGMAQGAGSILARAMGRGNQQLMKRVTTDGLLLAIVIVILVSGLGLLTVEPFFRLLGAEGVALELLQKYMTVWFAGALVVVMPPIGDSSMRALGDMVRPFIVMLVCAVMNIILDPILIFGLFGFPEMGISGAALATVISRSVGMITTLSFLHFRYHLISFTRAGLKDLFPAWKRILRIGFPAAIVRLFPQLQLMVLTRLSVSVGGLSAVAAIAAGSRVEGFAIIITAAVGMALVPLVGQNCGAGRIDRVDNLRKFINLLALCLAVLLFMISIPASKPIARIFSDETAVIRNISWYIRIIFLGSLGLNIFKWSSEMLNAAGRPKWVLLINLGGISLILIPMMWIGAIVSNYEGLIVGLIVGQLMLGLLSAVITKRQIGMLLAEG